MFAPRVTGQHHLPRAVVTDGSVALDDEVPVDAVRRLQVVRYATAICRAASSNGTPPKPVPIAGNAAVSIFRSAVALWA